MSTADSDAETCELIYLVQTFTKKEKQGKNLQKA